MRVLYHQSLSPFCRKVRIALAEKKLEFELRPEPVWERRAEFLALNPAGDLPVLVESDGAVLADSQAIVEYLEETAPEPPLLGGNAAGAGGGAPADRLVRREVQRRSHRQPGRREGDEPAAAAGASEQSPRSVRVTPTSATTSNTSRS